ncbi:MAG: hypothetical protein ABI675_15195 [Chitinophagaceae bacterium]
MKTNTKSRFTATEKPDDDPLTRPMIPLEQCRSIMNQGGLVYTDEELIIMRAFMYRLAEITTAHYDRKKAAEENESKVITLNKNYDHDETTSISLCPGEYGRTG